MPFGVAVHEKQMHDKEGCDLDMLMDDASSDEEVDPFANFAI